MNSLKRTGGRLRRRGRQGGLRKVRSMAVSEGSDVLGPEFLLAVTRELLTPG